MQRARALTGVSTIVDVGGRIAAAFGMRTSGHVLAYDHAGALVFGGGITPGRGLTGPTLGAEFLRKSGGASATDCCRADPATPTPIFGCPLVAPIAMD
jgi:hypothetical protein